MSRNEEFQGGVRAAHWATSDYPRPKRTPVGEVAHTPVTGRTYDEGTQDVFAYGQCHALAMAINKLEGHPIGVVKSKSLGEVHYFNYDKNDPSIGIDAWGRSPVKSIVGTGETHEPTNVSEIRSVVKKSRGSWMKPNVAAAMKVAHHVLGSEGAIKFL